MQTDFEAVDPSFLKFLSLKGTVKFEDAKDAWEEIRRYRQLQAAAVAKRLLGKQTRKLCPNCLGRGMVPTYCRTYCGAGEILDD